LRRKRKIIQEPEHFEKDAGKCQKSRKVEGEELVFKFALSSLIDF
jgi:hypothetical protein